MLHLILSIFCLLLAPFLSWAYHRYSRHYQTIDRLLSIVIGLFAALKLLPESFQNGGWYAIGLATLGFALPTAAERLWRKQFERVDSLPLMLAVTGFLVHDFIDGAALMSPFATPTLSSLAWAIILHRLPEGVIIWWVLYPKFGRWLAWMGLLSMAGATAGGYAFGGRILWNINYSSQWAAWLQALLAGSLLHLLTHKYHSHDEHEHHHAHD